MTIIRICRFFLNYLPKFNHCLTWSAVQNARSSLTCKEEICVGLHVVGLFARPTFLSTLSTPLPSADFPRPINQVFDLLNLTPLKKGVIYKARPQRWDLLCGSPPSTCPRWPLSIPLPTYFIDDPAQRGAVLWHSTVEEEALLLKPVMIIIITVFAWIQSKFYDCLMGEHFSLSNEDTPYQ